MDEEPGRDVKFPTICCGAADRDIYESTWRNERGDRASEEINQWDGESLCESKPMGELCLRPRQARCLRGSIVSPTTRESGLMAVQDPETTPYLFEHWWKTDVDVSKDQRPKYS